MIDLRSDTVTKPTAAMRSAMAEAAVGDDVYGEDPTVNLLEERASLLTGKPAALFVPSGTMANQIAIRAQTESGDALIAGGGAHIDLYEAGGAAALSGVHTTLIGKSGLFSASQFAAALLPDDIHFPRTRLVCIENTHNRSGGRIFPQNEINAIAEIAHRRGLALHLDGARIFNASVASNRPIEELTRPFTSVSFCLSKGLGAPVGSLLCGDSPLIKRARRLRKLFGGGMRQAGILAAAGLYALDNNIERLADDHRLATQLATGIQGIPRIETVVQPESNMILFETPGAVEVSAQLREKGVLIGLVGPTSLRAVTHMDISDRDIELTVATFRTILDPEDSQR